jgi:hypothetical protein
MLQTLVVTRAPRQQRGDFLYSKEGVSQGCPLSIDILPLICLLNAEFPAVVQRWYANDAGAGGNFEEIHRFFHTVEEIGPSYDYFPEPWKGTMVIKRNNQPRWRSSSLVNGKAASW